MAYIAITNTNQCSCNCGMRCIVDGRTGSSMRCTKSEIEAKGFHTIKVDAFFFDEDDILIIKPKVSEKKLNFIQRMLKIK